MNIGDSSTKLDRTVDRISEQLENISFLNYNHTERFEHVHLPAQVTPFPAYPGLHVHVKLPLLLPQVASVSQPPLFVAQSSIPASTHDLPHIMRNEQLHKAEVTILFNC